MLNTTGLELYSTAWPFIIIAQFDYVGNGQYRVTIR